MLSLGGKCERTRGLVRDCGVSFTSVVFSPLTKLTWDVYNDVCNILSTLQKEEEELWSLLRG